MNPPKVIHGHFSFVLKKGTPMNTSITTQKKSKVREKEAAKKELLLRELSALTGTPMSGYAKRYDDIVRRWTGVKSNGHDH